MEWIVANDVSRESWSRLLEFANLDFSLNEISRRHGTARNTNQADNYKKQAQQIRACLLQSQEYFTAAKNSSLITSPNHAYYGMVSLASSIMLLLGDGRKSLDYLRQNPANKNHGLRFSTGATRSSAGNGLSILEESHAEILSNGHFRLWYETLPSSSAVYGLEQKHGKGSQISRLSQLGESQPLKFDKLNGSKFSALRLMKFLPDLYGELGRYKAKPDSSRFTHESVTDVNGQRTDTWLIHGAGSSDALTNILESFKVPARNLESLTVNIAEEADGGVVSYIFREQDFPINFSFPSSRVALSFERICYADEIDVIEFVDIYIASFTLSMLSRYFPDLWVSCLESNCLASKLIERFSELLVNKAPMLALSIMSGKDCFVSSNRQPWAK